MGELGPREILVLASLPLVSGFVGHLTNRVALWMLFRPRRERRLLGLSFHGLLPSRQGELARSVAATVTAHLLTPETVAEKLQEERVREALLAGLLAHARRYVADLLDGLPAPVLMLLPRDVEDRINRELEKHARRRLPELAAELAPVVARELELAPAIERRIASYPPEKLEAMVKDIARRELAAIELWGGVLGFLIGLMQAAALLLLRWLA